MLKNIQSPQDLHRLNQAELKELAAEIRQKILETVISTGGHLGANLGVVELTLALHSILNSPQDKIIWDVGHQCYPHKLITGRYSDFDTLRQKGGISGFPNPAESPHDSFITGHASTSISVAAGMAVARDLNKQKHVVAAVIGDGALTGGMAFEALNHAGQLETDLLVILNDNAMSIANNVGALSNYLNELRLDPTLWRARTELESFIRRIPAVGEKIGKLGLTLKDAIKSLLPGQFFEELGFSYFGPFDGHNIKQLQKAIGDGISRGGPVLIHAITQKGKGFAPAEEDPSKYHGLCPSDSRVSTVHSPDSTSFSSVFGRSMVEFAAQNEKIVAVTAAMKDGTGLAEFADKYEHRFVDVGIAEQHSLTLAAGLASQGLRPVVAVYSTFLQRAYDQIIHDICLPNLPVILAIDRGGAVGDDGPTHHGVFDLSYLRPIPNLTILAPADGAELQAMLKWALAQSGPVAIRYPKAETRLKDKITFSSDQPIPSQLVLPGDQCSIFAVGPMVNVAVEAAKALAPSVRCSVVNARSIKPLDQTTLLEAAAGASLIWTIEDNVVVGGFGTAVLELLALEGKKVINFGYPDRFIPQARIDQLHKEYKLSAEGLAKAIYACISLNPL